MSLGSVVLSSSSIRSSLRHLFHEHGVCACSRVCSVGLLCLLCRSKHLVGKIRLFRDARCQCSLVRMWRFCWIERDLFRRSCILFDWCVQSRKNCKRFFITSVENLIRLLYIRSAAFAIMIIIFVFTCLLLCFVVINWWIVITTYFVVLLLFHLLHVLVILALISLERPTLSSPFLLINSL